MDTEALIKLNELKEQGFITQEEFEQQKKLLLTTTTHNLPDTKKNKGTILGDIKSVLIGIFLLFIAYKMWCAQKEVDSDYYKHQYGYDIRDGSENNKYQGKGIRFACDETSMRKAQDLINKSFPNWNDSLRLSNPVTAKQSEKWLKCKANSNFREFPTMSYELTDQSDGTILISTNPIYDKINEELDKFDSDLDSFSPDSEDAF